MWREGAWEIAKRLVEDVEVLLAHFAASTMRNGGRHEDGNRPSQECGQLVASALGAGLPADSGQRALNLSDRGILGPLEGRRSLVELLDAAPRHELPRRHWQDEPHEHDAEPL